MKNLIITGLAASLLMLAVVASPGAAGRERIAVAANGESPAAAVAAQPGRSPFFLIFDNKGTFMQALANPYKDRRGSAISMVDLLASKGVAVLVAVGYGPRIVDVMKGKGIRAVAFTGRAADAVKKALGPM
jgi:predicted Fe-Mo cluster-binding NifX family protein